MSAAIPSGTEVKRIRVENMSFSLRFSRADGVLDMKASAFMIGDLKGQINEAKLAYLRYLERASTTGYEELIKAPSRPVLRLLSPLLEATEVDLSVLSLEIRYPYPEDLMFVQVEGLMISWKPEPSKTFDNVKALLVLAREMPEGIGLVVEGGSAEEFEVVIEAPHIAGAKPRSVAIGRDLTKVAGISVKVRRNPWRVADYLLVTREVRIANATFSLNLAINSTLKDFRIVEREKKLLLVVEGPKWTKGSINLTLPKEMLEGASKDAIRVYIDGKETKSLTITEDDVNFYVYLSYPHSIHVIEVTWAPVMPIFLIIIIASAVTAIALILMALKKIPC